MGDSSRHPQKRRCSCCRQRCFSMQCVLQNSEDVISVMFLDSVEEPWSTAPRANTKAAGNSPTDETSWRAKASLFTSWLRTCCLRLIKSENQLLFKVARIECVSNLLIELQKKIVNFCSPLSTKRAPSAGCGLDRQPTEQTGSALQLHCYLGLRCPDGPRLSTGQPNQGFLFRHFHG